MFNKEEVEAVFMKAKVIAYITRSTNPDKEKLLEQLRAKMEEACELVDKILEGEF
jgi:hypothetical protein